MIEEDPQIQAILTKGIQAHQAAQLDEASASYQLILDNFPDHADANHLLGVIAHQLGEHSKAVQLIDKAIKSNDTAAPFYNNLGNAQRALSNLENAADCYRKALNIKPDDTGALSNLGLTLAELGRSEDAINFYKKALQIDPNILETNMRLGILLDEQNRMDEAIKYFQIAVAMKPDDPDIHNFLAIAHYKNHQLPEAKASIQLAISINPNEAANYSYLSTIQLEMKEFEDAAKSCHIALEKNNQDVLAHNNLGVSLVEMERREEAETSFRNVLDIDPDYADALNNLGCILQEQSKLEEATDCFQQAVRVEPKSPNHSYRLANIYEYQGFIKKAEKVYRRVLELDPDHYEVKTNLSVILLRLGQLKEGWFYYENRHTKDRRVHFFPYPKWEGSTLVGKKIILWGDQGLGDEVRFASIIPDLQKTGANITIECDKRLTDIFTRSFPDATIIAAPYGGATNKPEQFDYQCPMAGLARFFRNNFESFENADFGYLKADPALIKFWEKRLANISDQPKIGLSWNNGSVNIPGRAPFHASIEELAPILNIEGVEFINLQSFESKEDLKEASDRFGVKIHSWDDFDIMNDLNGVAALTSCLDLVISFPNFSAELAGALDIPTLCFVNHKDSFDELGSKDNIWHRNTHHICNTNRSYHFNTEIWQPVFEEIAEIVQSKFELQSNKIFLGKALGEIHTIKDDQVDDLFSVSHDQHVSMEKYIKILQEDPNNAQASFFLGLLLHQVNETEKAEPLITQAITLGHENYDVYCTLGEIYRSMKEFEKSSLYEKKAIDFNPDYIDGHYNIGCNFLSLGNFIKAIESFRHVISQKPDHYKAHHNLGLAYYSEKMFKDAIDSYNNALKIKPDFSHPYLGKGNSLREMGHPEDAVANFRKAIALDADFAEAHNNLGTTLKDLGSYEGAIHSFNRAKSLAPKNPGVRKNIGMINLQMGNFEEGWQEYSWRRFEENVELAERIYSQPLWTGEDLKGKTILVYTEQGLGDTIQFVRYLDLLQDQGGHVVLDAPIPLIPLLENMECIAILSKENDLIPPFDYHVPLMELPRLFSTNVKNIPSPGGYLRANKELVKSWEKRLQKNKGFRIGISWAGSSTYLNDRDRSMNLKYFEPLLGIKECNFFSLQFGERCQDIITLGLENTLKDLGKDLGGFMEPAAAINNMDLVISVDSSMAHLAGALGKPVWTLLSFNPDWRWMLNRSDSPWYSSMKLFRQEKRQDWQGVIERVKNELITLVK